MCVHYATRHYQTANNAHQKQTVHYARTHQHINSNIQTLTTLYHQTSTVLLSTLQLPKNKISQIQQKIHWFSHNRS